MTAVLCLFGVYLVGYHPNYNVAILSVLTLLSILVTIFLDKIFKNDANIVKSTVASYILTLPAQEVYSNNFAPKFMKEFSLYANGATVLLLLFWFTAAYLECRYKGSPFSYLQLTTGAIYVCVGYFIVNYKAVFSLFGVAV